MSATATVLAPVPLDLGRHDMPVTTELLGFQAAALDCPAKIVGGCPKEGGGFDQGHLQRPSAMCVFGRRSRVPQYGQRVAVMPTWFRSRSIIERRVVVI